MMKTNETHGIVGQIARIRELANLLIEKELAKRSIEGIVPAHGPVLHFLFQQSKPVPIKAVVDKVGRVKSTVTVMINTLEKHGVVRKAECAKDNRVVRVELTAKGKKLRKDFEAISKILLDKIYGDMEPKDRQVLVDLLGTIEINLER
jgi:DNA-binding MarR family transcriptional regulator